MKLSVIAILLTLFFGSWFALRVRAKSTHEGYQPIVSNHSNKDPADTGKQLRRMMLTMPAQELGVSPTREFPRVYGILVDASARAASAAFVKAPDGFYESAVSTSEYPYPAGDKIRFYLLTFHGVRVIETDMASVTHGSGPYAELFGLGQSVMTQLRLSTERARKPSGIE